MGAGPLIEPVRSWTQLVTSNGYTGVVVSLEDAQVHHFREHIYATEEPEWRDDGEELWEPTVPEGDCWKPQVVNSRDLLRDAYFGVNARGASLWLNSRDVDLDASGYDGTTNRPDRNGGTGIVRMVQQLAELELEATTRVFAPWETEWGSWVMALELTNQGATSTGPVNLYGLVNANLGDGRPGAREEIGAAFETIRVDGSAVIEQGYAGTIAVRPLPDTSNTTHSPATFYDQVALLGGGDLPLPSLSPVLGDEQASAYQWTVPDIAPGESVWVGLVVGHDPNPDFDEGRLAAIDAWVSGRTVEQIWTAEREAWSTFQDRLLVPDGMSVDETDLYHHSATVLRMAQVRESSYWVRPTVTDGVARRTGVDFANEAVAGEGVIREHLGRGAVLASLPPGEWAYAWVRDGAYAIVGLTDGGLFEEARLALEFYLTAHANRYVDFEELNDVPLGDYSLSLTRYHGFGIEESDTTCNGDLNFEWDGFGLYLWALRHYVEVTGDTSLLDDHWPEIRDQIGAVSQGLIDETGLLWPDSSIWEVHWFGDEKRFAYTDIAVSRGLCDLAWMARQIGEDGDSFEDSGRQLRRAIYDRLRNSDGAIAANLEELAAGTGYWDAAVVEAVGMGLFDPTGPTATATMNAIRDNLTVPSGCGIFRNDDEFDAHDLSPYGGPYDTLEWIFLDYRASIAARHSGDDAYADGLQDWVRDQTLLNYLLIAENYDGASGEYRNNAPMIGFGSGSYISAMRQRAGDWDVDAACGFYFEDDPVYGPGAGGDDVGVPDEDPVDVGPEPDPNPDVVEDAVPDADATSGTDTDTTVEPDVQQDSSDDTAADGEQDSEPEDTPLSDDGEIERELGSNEASISGGGCVLAASRSTHGSWLVGLAALGLIRRRRR
ncbi:MAG: GH15 family glucan-1,4-alpha-glucosidase [Bradymonadia bacterium]|jgi:GH15 family glucan-1,4-alpha-glucosidase